MNRIIKVKTLSRIIFCILFLTLHGSASFQAAEKPSIPDFPRGQWNLIHTDEGGLKHWEGKLLGSPSHFFFSNLPFFPTIIPSSEDLFRGFFQVLLDKSPVDWDRADFSPQTAFKYRPKSHFSPKFSQNLCYDAFPILRRGNPELLWVLVGLRDQRSFYLTWVLPQDLEVKSALKEVLKLFKHSENK